MSKEVLIKRDRSLFYYCIYKKKEQDILLINYLSLNELIFYTELIRLKSNWNFIKNTKYKYLKRDFRVSTEIELIEHLIIKVRELSW